MFVPELISGERCILVHNHDLQTPESVALSAKFTKARLENAVKHLPSGITLIEVSFDCRGQDLHRIAARKRH